MFWRVNRDTNCLLYLQFTILYACVRGHSTAMWVVGESSVSNQGRQRWEGWESKAGAETERIRKQKTKKPKTKNEGREIDIVNRIFGEIYFPRSFP